MDRKAAYRIIARLARQDAMGHAEPRTTHRYDRSRRNLDRHATYTVTALLADDLPV